MASALTFGARDSYIASQIDEGLGFAQAGTSSSSGLESGAKQGGVIRMPIQKVLIQSATPEQNTLSQVSQVQPQGVELLQIDSTGETSIASDHVIMPLTNHGNYGYIGIYYIGAASDEDDDCSGELQPIRMILDTGSANSWVVSNLAVPDDGSYTPFDPSKSCHFEEPAEADRQNTRIQFGSGHLNGYFVKDDVTIGNIESSNLSDRLSMPEYTFGMVNEQTCFQSNFDAIVGLAYPEFAEPNVIPFFDHMMETEILKHNMFAFFMSLNPDEEESEVMFGSYDQDRIDPEYNEGTGELDCHDVLHKLFWSIKLDDIKINGESLHLCDDKDCLFTPDTGTSLITFPSWASDQFDADHPEWINGDCIEDGLEHGYGDLTYVINGIDYPIPSHHWMKRRASSDDSPDQCEHTIGTLDVGQRGLDNLFIGGDYFMQFYYTIFNRDDDQVCFAKALHTAPEEHTIYDKHGVYVETQLLCEESYIDPQYCQED